MRKLCNFPLCLIIGLFIFNCHTAQADIEAYEKQRSILSEQAKLPKEEKSSAVAWTMAAQTQTKRAFSRAQKRLKKIQIGMSTSKFIKRMKLQTMTDDDGSVIASYGDGWLRTLDLQMQTPWADRHEYVFGYIQNGIARERVIVICENNKVTDILELPESSVKDIDWQEVESRPISYSWSKEAFPHARERVKDLEIGMARWQMENVMNGNWMELQPGRLYFICDGYLHRLYEKEDTPSGCKQQFYFGYTENEQDFPKFVVTFLNGEISEIRDLDSVPH